MRYLYVLTSTPNDIYYEQFLLSVFSLKQIMPNANIVLLCDTNTESNLTGIRSEYLKYVTNVVSTEAPPEYNQVEVSRWLKTSMRRLISGDFLFIDSDTIVTGDLSDIKDLNIQFGACLDKHSLINNHHKAKDIISNDKKLGFTSYISDKHYNSGVIYCADTPQMQNIFNRWHELWLSCKNKKLLRDQPSFNMVIYENLQFFTELDGIWNCQITYNGLRYFVNSKIIHYFATDLFLYTSPFILISDEIINSIKETGSISPQIFTLLKNPRKAFADQTRIVYGETLNVVNSNYFEFLTFLKKETPLLFSIINKIMHFCKIIVKFFVVASSKKKDSGTKHYN